MALEPVVEAIALNDSIAAASAGELPEVLCDLA